MISPLRCTDCNTWLCSRECIDAHRVVENPMVVDDDSELELLARRARRAMQQMFLPLDYDDADDGYGFAYGGYPARAWVDVRVSSKYL